MTYNANAIPVDGDVSGCIASTISSGDVQDTLILPTGRHVCLSDIHIWPVLPLP